METVLFTFFACHLSSINLTKHRIQLCPYVARDFIDIQWKQKPTYSYANYTNIFVSETLFYKISI